MTTIDDAVNQLLRLKRLYGGKTPVKVIDNDSVRHFDPEFEMQCQWNDIDWKDQPGPIIEIRCKQ